MTGLDELFSESDEGDDPRPLRRLAVASGLGLAAAIVVLVAGHGELRTWVVGVWIVVVVSGLLLLGAVVGLWSRHTVRTRPRTDPDELRDRLAAVRLLRRGELPPPELALATQRAVDEQDAARWGLLGRGAMCLFWIAATFAQHGWSVYLWLANGILWTGMTAGSWWTRSRVLGTAARADIRPRRTTTSRRRGTIAR